MTQIKQRPLKRETATSIRDGGKLLPIIVELHPGYLVLRQKGRRRGLVLDYSSAYVMAAQALADERRRAKVQARGGKVRRPCL
jgi:hypothetical protein